MAFTTLRLLLIGNVYRPSIAFPNRINLFSVRQIKSIILSIIISLPLTVTLFSSNAQARKCRVFCRFGKGAGSEAARILTENGVPVRVEVDDQGIITILDRTQALVDYSILQAQALSRSVGYEYRESMQKTFYELDEYTKMLDDLAKQRIDQLDKAGEDRIRQILEGIEGEILLLSQEMTNQILAIEEAVKSSSSHISDEVQQATITASDELAKLLGITREQVDYLLRSSEEKLLNILSYASDEINDLVQENINLTFARAEKLTMLGFDEFNKSTNIITDEVRAIVTQWEGSSKVIIANAANYAVDVTDNLSDESKEVIEFGVDRLKKLSSHIAKDVLIIQEEIKISRMETIIIAGKTAIVFVNRTADLILAVGSGFAGIIFLFVSSYGWGNNFLKNPKLPDNYAVRVIIFSLMGMTFVASFTPFVFLIPKVRVQALSQFDQVETLDNLIPQRKFSPSPDRRIQGRLPAQSPQEPPTSISSSQEELISLEKSCGDYSFPENVESIQVYKVFVEYTSNTLATIKSEYCKDAWQSSTDVIQVAIFDNYFKAEKFSTFISNELNTIAEIQESSLKNKNYRDPVDNYSNKNSSSGSYLDSSSNSISQQEALDLINRWVSAKRRIAAPPFDMNLISDLLMGEELLEQKKKTNWLKDNNEYYTYQRQDNVNLQSFIVDNNQATVKVYGTEKRTFCRYGEVVDDVYETRLYTYILQPDGNQWKIVKYDSSRQGNKKNNEAKTCDIN